MMDSENSDVNQEEPIQAQLVEPASENLDSRLVQSRVAVLAMLFLVTGFLGIPLLWMNKSFSSTERIVWAIVVTIYTLALIAFAAAVVMWSYRRINGMI